MYGNVISGRQLEEMVDKQKIIRFNPFDPKLLKTIHYPLHPGEVLRRVGVDENGSVITASSDAFDKRKGYYIFEANEFALIRVNEFISLPKDIVGQIVPSSDLVMNGFLLTAGRLEYPFGEFENGRQGLVFGIKNLLNEKNKIYSNRRLCWIYFVDLRGVKGRELELSAHDRSIIAMKMFRMQRQVDDGVFYDDVDE